MAVDESLPLRSRPTAAANFEVWGVPTFIAGDKAAFGRLMVTPDGDPAVARRTIERIAALAVELCAFVPGADRDRVRSAAELCKADLVTGMVGEFPELQGIMGRYLDGTAASEKALESGKRARPMAEAGWRQVEKILSTM